MAKDFNIARTLGQCACCERKLEENEQYMALVTENGEDLNRSDWCLECWPTHEEKGLTDIFGQWKAKIPVRQEKKKLLVDDDLLINFFTRLADDERAERIAFRFVLALVLMRKKILLYQSSSRRNDGVEVWSMKFKKQDELHEVINPELDEDSIENVSQQLGDILQGDL